MRHAILNPTAAFVALAFTVGLPVLPARATPPAAKPPVNASRPAEPAMRKYSVTASDGGIIPGHIRMRKGETIRITFVSRDDKYSIRFKDFDIKETLLPGTPVVIEISPSRAGTYEFRCARVWGVKRLGHNGSLVVTD